MFTFDQHAACEKVRSVISTESKGLPALGIKIGDIIVTKSDHSDSSIGRTGFDVKIGSRNDSGVDHGAIS
jgi:hypothetical protein